MAADAVAHLTRDHGPDGFWIHLDVDVLDDSLMPAVDYRIPGGLSWEELTTLLAAVLRSPRAVGLELTIFKPDLDPGGSVGADLAVRLGEVLAGAR